MNWQYWIVILLVGLCFAEVSRASIFFFVARKAAIILVTIAQVVVN
jgi:hypothetical protein